MTYIRKLIKVFLGIILYALGVVITIEARIGFSPWEVFHAGLANVLNLQIGTISIGVGLILITITTIFGEKIGMATVLNIIFVGLTVNLILNAEIIPTSKRFSFSIIQMTVGLFIMVFATYLYLSTGLGAGPRDAFMVLINRRTGIKVGIVRSLIEITVTILGALMGGLFGWGTIMAAVIIGIALQTVFRIFKFDPRTVEHEDIKTTLTSMLNRPAP
ncbi:MAG: hypothetical protein EWM48_00305 [Sphaerochaeta sp.]|nr:MAG: hypothetical protein EWM48_00305 [Sphaerochaeta sp.]HNZ94873.1 hypothetical protein [Sphaerochaeta sp.]HPB42669.1 hypothetical protein [Sphaerochaeta sp.]HPY45237.1 hypothetical protein [Sphaerochaeta sp.]HQB04956.1 hypothetical protein [Sphaerochaeta sp.]